MLEFCPALYQYAGNVFKKPKITRGTHGEFEVLVINISF